MDEKQLEELRAEGQFAINDPEAYVLSNPTPHDWTMSAQEIARSVKINPLRFGFTTEEIEGPRKLNMVETAIKGSWDNIVQGVNDFDSMMNVRDVEYSSPNMTEAEATRLMQDALYTRHKGRESSQELTAQKIKYNTLYDISNAVGSLIKYVGLGFITGSPAAVGAVAGLESMAGMEADMVDRYIDQTGGIEGYDKKRRSQDLGIAGSYGIFTAITESMLGVDRIAAGALGRYSTIDAASRLARIKGQLTKSGLLQAGRRFGMSAIEEGAEEFIQSVGEDVANYIAGYEDAVFTDENLKKALTSALYGAMLGGPAGWFVYRYNRKSVIDKINKMSQERNWGLTDQQIAEATDQIIEDAKTTMVDEIATRAEIKNHYGQAYELVKQRITEQIDATGTTPWTDQNKSKEEYITVLADSITIPAVNMANVLNIPLSEFLEIADINTATIAGNIAWLQPITSVEDINKIIADQDAIIKQEREAKKLGVDDDAKLKLARSRKAIAERVRKQIIGEQALRTIRKNRKKETADYVKAKDLQPEQVNTLENAVRATGDQDYVLFGGIRIPVDYQVVELATIQPSHIDGTPNPAYSNVELQNRASRGTAQDVADLREKATNITPERLMRASTSAEGAPVVNAKGEVIAGNGREEIIRYAYENPETAEKYKQELVKQGFNIEGMQQPILVRRNATMTDQEQIAAADISNISETSAFDNASQARRDTQYLKDSKTPTEFASKLPMSERRGLMQNNGKWNKRKVQQRYEDALLAWLCGNDTQLFENLVLDRGLSQKVINILTDNGTLIYETATKYPDIELREDIYHALVKMQKATRDNFLEITQQLELDGHDVMPENIIIWNWLFADITTNRQFLQSYATTLASNRETVNAGEDMFGQSIPPLSKKDALMQALKKADQAKAETVAARGREYAPLFDENGMATDVNLAAAIASYNNQFAPVNTGNQLSPEVLQQFDLADENARLDDIYPAYDGETIEVDGKERTVYNSNGDRIAKSKEALTNFWRWFGDSKVVDEQGRPLVVYHGTDAEFDTFDLSYFGETDSGTKGKGIYLTQREKYAKYYGNIIMPLYTSIQNPFMMNKATLRDVVLDFYKWMDLPVPIEVRVDYTNGVEDAIYNQSEKFTQYLQEKGFDGVIDITQSEKYSKEKGFEGVDRFGEIVAFEPTQIKSVDNRGTYSSDTGNIYYQTEVYDGLITTKIWNVMRTLRGLKDSSTERLLYDKQKDTWFLENADDATHVQMFIKAFNQGNYPEFNNEREAEQYFQENYLADDQNLLQFLAQKYDNPADTKQAMEHTLGTDEYTNAYLRDNIVIYTRYDSDFAESGLPVESFDHYKATYDENNNRTITLEEKAKPTSDKNLVVTHGIGVDKLERALKLGGFPVPSIAISKISEPLTNFGAIKLVGTKETINPELRSSNLVYDRDIWSKRFPRPEYKNAKLTDVRKFRDKFEKYFVRADNTSVLYGSITDPLVNSRYPAQAIEAFQNSDGAKLYYIENILGDKIDVPKYDRAKRIFDNLTLFVKPDEQFVKEIAEIDVNIDNIDKLRKEIEKPIRDLINRFDFEKQYGQYADKIKQEAENHYFSEKFKGSDITYMIRSAKEYLRMLKDDNIRYGVDSMGLDSVLNKYNLYDNQDYMDWSEKQITDLLGEPRVRVGNRLLAWTPENITAAMIKGRTIGAESDSISIGKIIASGAKRFSNLESIREEGKRLQPQKQSEEQTDQLGHDMYMFAEDIIAAAELSDNYSNVDMVLLSLQEGVSRNSITEDGLEKLLNKNLDILAKYPRNMLKRGVNLIKQTKEIVRFYFEAKPQRFVSFNEFAGAVVPTNSRYDEIASKLAERGLYVARTDNLEEGIRYIESQTPVLFQKRGRVRGTYDPELQAIILTKYWNETTLVHEYHHRYLEKLWGYFKQAQTGERAVSDEFLADMDKLFQMLEIDPAQDKLTTVQQEKFATMVEAYLTGLGVDNQDNLAFQSFLHWIPEQYKSIMDLGYLDENNEIQNPILDQESIDWFNKWFACPFAPSLASAPDAQRIVNPTDETGQIVPSSQKIMNNREKEWGQDSEEQNKADAQLWRAINENTPNDMRAALDGEKVNMKAATNNLPDDTQLPEPHKPTLRDKWFKTYQPNARERAANMAREYLALNPEHARELAFADPETMTEFDAPVDQGMLIRAVMETVPHGSDEWYILNDNLATVKSMSGSTLSLSGDLSHQAYLDAKREVEAARELKAAVNYAGTRRGAMDKWNNDIKAFIARRTETLLATEPDSEERKTAIKAFLEEAKTKFSANTTDAVLNQLDLTGIKTKNRQVFIKWAEKQIKQAAHAKIDANEQKELIKASIAAQLALKEIDSTVQVDGKYTRAVQSAKDIRHWQFVKDKMKKAYIGRWGKFGIFWDNLFGSYAPSAMLMSVNTLFFANVPSTAINTGTIRLAAKTIGKNNVDEATQKGEIERIKQVFNASGVNLAQMDKPTSPSTLHGEKYTKSEQSKWYNFTFEVLGRTDNEFRIPTFVDALARIATKDAGGDKAKATVLFKEYAKLNNQSDEAKIARKQALAVANMAVFTQDGTLATGLNQIRTVLNTISRVPLGLEPQGFGLGNILAPFLKTGANITEMGFDAMLAPIRTMAVGFQKLQGKEIPDIKKLALTVDWINLAWTAVMIALMAAISGDDDEWYTEPYTSGRKYDAEKPYDSIRFGNVWVKMDMFGPISVPLRTAAMLIKDWEDKKLAAIGDGMYEALSETPLVQQFTDSSLDYMSKQPEKYWSSFGYNQANKLVPAQAKSVIKATSRATDAQLDTNWLGKTIDRKFHRNYGLDGERLTTNDLIQLLTNRLKYTE